MSDAMRRAVVLVIAELAEESKDPELIKAAKTVNQVRTIQFREGMQELERIVQLKGPMFGVSD